ncbi:type II toxin-antitoxin system HicB family antitoxin [Lichenihabitans sp. Uapishka_5]|uniref:type II toxin-antitoxin system HicB family antitoxin n=1 Tax=Lichenihabitans sp. Uapishka_5 TaxID=3037302 RepID=UPI0029E802B1|nr:type II toxin-antitoxin system HicB family antitoxin [Lichenihabitans sp. Uapishka_5]MDX7952672.1 type II toxin-antitoxin system HicB family antitoxin [Lichenihabitans sp. Uapishka_5]
MARYIAILDIDDEAVGAEIPDCPGCTAMGRDEDEAVQAITEALREWMADRIADGVAPPVPRSIKMLDRAGFLSGTPGSPAVFASIPLLLDESRLVRANISLDAGFLKTIDQEAKLRGLTRSAFLTSAAREKISAGR